MTVGILVHVYADFESSDEKTLVLSKLRAAFDIDMIEDNESNFICDISEEVSSFTTDESVFELVKKNFDVKKVREGYVDIYQHSDSYSLVDPSYHDGA